MIDDYVKGLVVMKADVMCRIMMEADAILE